MLLLPQNKGREAPHNPINDTLAKLLHSIGFDISEPTPSDQGSGPCFVTNDIHYLDNGGLQGNVHAERFANCDQRFLGLTIDLIAPRAVVSLSEQPYRAVTMAYGPRRMRFRSAVE